MTCSLMGENAHCVGYAGSSPVASVGTKVPKKQWDVGARIAAEDISGSWRSSAMTALCRLLNLKWLLIGNDKVTKGHPFVRVSFLVHTTVFGLSFNLCKEAIP